jgi:hypothetical protein
MSLKHQAVKILPFVLVLAAAAQAGSPTQYDTVTKALENTHEFSVVEGTLKVLSTNPWKVEIPAYVFPGDESWIIDEEVKRTLVFALIITFAQTNVDQITVTVVPVEQSFGKEKSKPLKSKARTLSVSRGKMNKVLLEKAGLKDCKSLVGPKKIGDNVLPDMLLGATDKLIYNDQGEPGLNTFFEALSR